MKPALLRRALESRPVRAGLRLLERFDSRNPAVLRVLTYHVIEDSVGFREQMQHLAARYHPLTAAEVEGALAERGALPPRAVLVTFDDGDRNFGEVAWPILREVGVPAHLFVATDYPDQPERRFWWDELIHAVHQTQASTVACEGGSLSLGSASERQQAIRVLKQEVQRLEPRDVGQWIEVLRRQLDVEPSPPRVLSWTALRALVGEGLGIGAHTRSHPFLDRLDPDTLREEIEGSIDDLERELGQRPTTFAYPNGRYSEAVVEAVRRAGVSLAFTTERGPNDLRCLDPLRLRRINIGPRVGGGILQARLLQSSTRISRSSLPSAASTGPSDRPPA